MILFNYSFDKKTITDIPLFSELNNDELEQISSFSHIKKFNKNELIFSDGDKYTGFFIVLKGKVKVFKLSPAGKESVLHIFRPFEEFAEQYSILYQILSFLSLLEIIPKSVLR